jgi:surfeit locus 1 family protein
VQGPTKLPSIKNIFAALLALAILATLLGLGLWQVQRLTWKENLLASMAARQNQAPLETLPPASDDNDYKRVVLTGLLDRAAAFALGPRTLEGKNGNHWLVPMVMTDRTGEGVIVLVNLGWVPVDYQPPVTATAQVETLSGLLRHAPAPNMFTPANPATGRLLFWVDAPALSMRLGAPVYPYVLYADKMGDTPPVGGVASVSLPNNHLSYAITWFLLALIWVVMCGLAVRRHKKDESVG